MERPSRAGGGWEAQRWEAVAKGQGPGAPAKRGTTVPLTGPMGAALATLLGCSSLAMSWDLEVGKKGNQSG